MVQTTFAESLNRPVYIEWLIAQVLAGKIEADGLIDSWSDPSKYDTFGAWVACDWFGIVKPAVDASKLVAGDKMALEQGLTTRAKVARERYGTKFSKNIRQLTREIEVLAKAMAPIAALLSLEKAASLGTSLDAKQGELFDVDPADPPEPGAGPPEPSKDN
jgi:capsid protein